MKTLDEYIDILRRNRRLLSERYEVRSLSIFGSVSRNQQNDGSDLDVFVEMPPKMSLVIGVKQFLEDLLGCKVDVIRKHKGINPLLMKEIERDGVDVIGAA